MGRHRNVLTHRPQHRAYSSHFSETAHPGVSNAHRPSPRLPGASSSAGRKEEEERRGEGGQKCFFVRDTTWLEGRSQGSILLRICLFSMCVECKACMTKRLGNSPRERSHLMPVRMRKRLRPPFSFLFFCSSFSFLHKFIFPNSNAQIVGQQRVPSRQTPRDRR